jgi:hypothetical protein
MHSSGRSEQGTTPATCWHDRPEPSDSLLHATCRKGTLTSASYRLQTLLVVSVPWRPGRSDRIHMMSTSAIGARSKTLPLAVDMSSMSLLIRHSAEPWRTQISGPTNSFLVKPNLKRRSNMQISRSLTPPFGIASAGTLHETDARMNMLAVDVMVSLAKVSLPSGYRHEVLLQPSALFRMLGPRNLL